MAHRVLAVLVLVATIRGVLVLNLFLLLLHLLAAVAAGLEIQLLALVGGLAAAEAFNQLLELEQLFRVTPEALEMAAAPVLVAVAERVK